MENLKSVQFRQNLGLHRNWLQEMCPLWDSHFIFLAFQQFCYLITKSSFLQELTENLSPPSPAWTDFHPVTANPVGLLQEH